MDRQAVQVEQAVFNAENKRSKVRWMILAALFFITCINYADRAAISIAGPAITKELGLDAVGMGYVFSAFGWAYVAGQLPGGWLLDKFGSRRVYAWSIFIWSLFTFIQGGVAFLAGTAALIAYGDRLPLWGFGLVLAFISVGFGTTERRGFIPCINRGAALASAERSHICQFALALRVALGLSLELG